MTKKAYRPDVDAPEWKGRYVPYDIIKEGTIDALQDGKTNRLGAGSILFELPNEVQGIRNVGDTPATYFVVRWFAPGTLKTAN